MAARAALALAVLLAAAIRVVHSGVVAVGKLQTCVNDGSTPSNSLACSQKIVVTVELENNKLYETEQLRFGVSCVNSPNDQCPCPCNYATDANCPCRDLQQNVTVAATKTPVYASYPLTYTKYFNGRPYEAVIVGTSCRDGANDAGATCGFAQLNGNDVTDSQGFCCNCGSLINLGGSSGQVTRGNLNCGGIIQTQKSAHCLRLDPNWWHAGFTLGEYALDFSINLNITTVTAAANGSAGGNATATSSTQILKVDPSTPFQRDASRRVSAKLLGDLESYQQAPQLDGKFLLIPVAPGEGPQEAYSHRFNEWMVVDGSMVTLTGLDCDKIGVDYSGFRNSQPNACTTPSGSCLRNQISDLYAADLVRISSGLTPLYFVGRYGGGTDNLRQMSGSDMPGGGIQLSLNLPITAIKTSLMTLSVAADDVAFVVNSAPAQILSVRVCTYDGVTCGGFQALTTSGYLQVTVKNSGFVPADFTVGVNNCSVGVRSVQAQLQSIAAQSTAVFQFELRMESDAALNNTCTVAVAGALGDLAASQGFSFYTNATVYDHPPDQSDLGGQGGGGGGSKPDWCQQVCPNLVNLKCAVSKGCYSRLAKGIVALAGPLLGLGGLFLAWKSGHLSLILRILSAIFCSGRRAAAPQPPAKAPAAAAAAPGGDGEPHGRAKGRGRGQKMVQQDGDEAEEAAQGDGLIRAGGQGKWRGLQVGEEPPRGGERQRRRSSSMTRARDSLFAAAQQARDMLAGLKARVAGGPATAGEQEAATAAGQGQRGLPLRLAAQQWGAGAQPGSPQAASLGLTLGASPMAGGLYPFGGGGLAAAGLVQHLAAASVPGPPTGTPVSRAAAAAALSGVPGFAAPSPAAGSLEQQLRQVQQQRRLLRQLQQLHSQPSSPASLLSSPQALTAAGLGAPARTSSLPAHFLQAAAAGAPQGRQMSQAAQQGQGAAAAEGWLASPQAGQQAGQVFGPGPGSPLAAADQPGPVYHPQQQAPLASHLSAPPSLLQHQLSMAAQLPRLPAIRTGVPAPLPADVAGTPAHHRQLLQGALQQQQQAAAAVEMAARPGEHPPGAPGSQQPSMRALGIPAPEAQQQHAPRRPAGSASPPKSRFAGGA